MPHFNPYGSSGRELSQVEARSCLHKLLAQEQQILASEASFKICEESPPTSTGRREMVKTFFLPCRCSMATRAREKEKFLISGSETTRPAEWDDNGEGSREGTELTHGRLCRER